MGKVIGLISLIIIGLGFLFFGWCLLMVFLSLEGVVK